MINIRTDKLSFEKDTEFSIQKGEVYDFSAVKKRVSIKMKVLLTLIFLGGLGGAAYFLHLYLD